MSEYSYIGVAEDLVEGTKFLVRSNECPIFDGNIVVIAFGDELVYAEVIKAAYLKIGGEEEAMLAEFGKIHDAEKIYACAWDKKKEEMKNA